MEYFNNLVNSLSTQFGTRIPGVVGAIVVLILGYFIAKIVKRIVKKLLTKTSIDETIGKKLNTTIRVDDFVAKLCYYVVLIYTLMIVLNLLGVEGVLTPLENMMDQFVGFLPNGLAAGIIAYAGYMIASIASEATNFLTERAENFATKNAINLGSLSIAKIIKQLVFIFIFVPILIVALDTLKMDAISGSATAMLQSFLGAIPQIIAAVLLIAVFYIVGKFVVALAVTLMQNIGLDKLATSLGLTKVLGNASLSQTVGNIALYFIIFTGIIAAVEKLELFQIGEILNDILTISGKVFFGAVILAAGVFISNLAVGAVSNSKDNSWLAPIVKFATMGLFLAFALHTMGIAENIVEMAFGLTLGAIAVAFALSFGLGGKKPAGEHMDYLLKRIRKEK